MIVHNVEAAKRVSSNDLTNAFNDIALQAIEGYDLDNVTDVYERTYKSLAIVAKNDDRSTIVVAFRYRPVGCGPICLPRNIPF